MKPCRCRSGWIAAGLVLVGAALLIRQLLEAGQSAERSMWGDDVGG